MMSDAVKSFAEQFTFKPVVINQKKLKKADGFVICGMGGSQLAASVLRTWDPSLDIIQHRDYGLPAMSKQEMKRRLFIFSSYSGTTEEALDGYAKAKKLKLKMAVIAVGNTLIARAQKDGIPYVEIPNTGIQPRAALGFSLLGMLSLMQNHKGLHEAKKLAKLLQPLDIEVEGKKLAERLKDHVPVIYSSTQNLSVAYNWKIKFNETGKIPAFYNIIPELNHNEMNGFDATDTSKHLSERFHFIFILDRKDHPRDQKRFAILRKLYEDRKFPVTILSLEGKNRFHAIFSSLLLADWTAVYTAEQYGLESEQVPMVEEFKKLITE